MAASIAWTLQGSWPATSTAHAATRPPMPAAEPGPLDALDERGLVEACLAERAGAFDLIVERHRRAVYQLCYRFVGNHEDASDLSQDVFLRAYRGLRSFRGQSSLATWLYRIGVNVCLNRVSAKTTLGKLTEPIEEQQFVDDRAESPSDVLLQRGARRARARRDRPAAAQAARDADPAHVSRDVAPGDRRRARQLGRRGEGEFLSRARKPEEAARRRSRSQPCT